MSRNSEHKSRKNTSIIYVLKNIDIKNKVLINIDIKK